MERVAAPEHWSPPTREPAGSLFSGLKKVIAPTSLPVSWRRCKTSLMNYWPIRGRNSILQSVTEHLRKFVMPTKVKAKSSILEAVHETALDLQNLGCRLSDGLWRRTRTRVRFCVPPPSWPSPIKGEGTLDSSTIREKENQIFSPNKVTRASDFLSQQREKTSDFLSH